MAVTTAVVFAYHNVGARCLRVLLGRGIRVPLVVTHVDNPCETIWFASVAQIAAENGIPAITPEDPNTPEVVAQIAAASPDFIFSFYYRSLLKAPLLALPRRGALNMHGSLLPRYRGRVPVNWAIIHGETETGATLHYMTEKPDNGDIVAQQAVPILPDDTAREVFDKVTVAAEIALYAVLPSLVAGTAPRTPQDLKLGGYFGGRNAEHGRIDWSQPATSIHNLVRAVAPPYPGAFSDTASGRLAIHRTRIADPARLANPALMEPPSHIKGPAPATVPGSTNDPAHGMVAAGATGSPASAALPPSLHLFNGKLLATSGSGALELLDCLLDGDPLSPTGFEARFGPRGTLALS